MSDTPTQNRLRETLLTADGVGKIGKAKALAQLIASETDKLTRDLAEKERLRFGADADRRQLRVDNERLSAQLAAANAALAEVKTKHEDRGNLFTAFIDAARDINSGLTEIAKTGIDELRAELATRTQTEAGLSEQLSIAESVSDAYANEAQALREQVRVLRDELSKHTHSFCGDEVGTVENASVIAVLAQTQLLPATKT